MRLIQTQLKQKWFVLVSVFGKHALNSDVIWFVYSLLLLFAFVVMSVDWQIQTCTITWSISISPGVLSFQVELGYLGYRVFLNIVDLSK